MGATRLEGLTEFVSFMHPDMVGLTGTEQAVARRCPRLSCLLCRAGHRGDEFYLIDHTTFTYLNLPGHGFVELFRREATPDEMADRVACFIDNA